MRTLPIKHIANDGRTSASKVTEKSGSLFSLNGSENDEKVEKLLQISEFMCAIKEDAAADQKRRSSYSRREPPKEPPLELLRSSA